MQCAHLGVDCDPPMNESPMTPTAPEAAAAAQGSFAPPIAEPASSELLPLRLKAAYGVGDAAPAMAAVIISFFQLFFLTSVAGLSPIAAGSILLVARFVDGVTDPVMGWISDRTRSRFGRRRFWLLVGAVPFGVLFALQWLVPPVDPALRWWYYLVIISLFSVAFTVIHIPYTSLTPELTRDYNERTSLNSFRFAFSIGGSLTAGVLHPIVVGQFASPQVGYTVAGLLFGTLMIFPMLITFGGVRERHQQASDAPPQALLELLRALVSNRPYLFVVGIYLCSWMAIQVTSAVLPFYITFWLQRPDLFSVMILAVQGTALVFLFIWTWLSKRIGKKGVYLLGMLIWIAVQGGLFFVQPDQVNLAIGLGVLAGAGVATGYLMPWSMLPDVMEYDELVSGQRREGLFYGMMVFIQKLGIALGIFLVGVFLETQGFIADVLPGGQPDSALLAIRAMVGPVPSGALLLGIVLTIGYPITRRKHAEITAQLAARRAQVVAS